MAGAEVSPGASTNSPPGSGPSIQFAQKAYDFGKVTVGELVKHDFVFTNAGDGVLVIKDVHSTCGCTSATRMTRQVAPGTNGIIPIELHTVNFDGPVSKTITITSNDPQQPTMTLQLTGTVWRPLNLVPQTAAFTGLLDAPTNSFRKVRIINKQTEPLRVWEPVSNQRAFVPELSTNQPGEEYELVIKLVPPLGTGNIFGEIKLKTSAEKMPVLTVPVWALAQPAVAAIPTVLTLPASPLKAEQKETVSIRSIWSQPLVLSEPSISAKAAQIEMHELQPGRFFALAVTFPAGFEIAANEHVELTVKSNHPQYPLIRVPVVRKARASTVVVQSTAAMVGDGKTNSVVVPVVTK